MKTGSCLCGAVAFELHGPLDDVIACHCSQCRKMTGNYWTSTHTADADLKFTRQDALKWFASSDGASRGFCAACGSSLFWKKSGENITSICAGSIDGKTGLKLGGHIFTADAGDYYVISGGNIVNSHQFHLWAGSSAASVANKMNPSIPDIHSLPT